jgi:rhodanese-related sulfurtransferase
MNTFDLAINRRKTIGAILVITLMLASGGVLSSVVNAQTTPNYTDITVDNAYRMIQHPSPNQLILDVRNQSEYDMGHLYNAVLVPLYELNDSINELKTHLNSQVIVYCASGVRSAKASQILADAGFTNINNMEGGITAWMQAGYSIDTTRHYVSVATHDDRKTIQIEPYLLYAFDTNCPCQNNTNDQESSLPPLNYTVNVL